VLVCALAPGAGAKLTLEIDYSLDTNGFFLPAATNPFGFDGDAAKAQLQRAANLFADRFVDDLSAITPRIGMGGVEYTWTPEVRHPATGADQQVGNIMIPANVIKVYAGGRSLSGTTLGVGGAGGWGASGFDEWFEEIEGRGQAGALAVPQTDVAPWGGSITFDSVGTNWHFGATTSGIGLKSDFYSVAVHELAHLLGIGTAGSWQALAAGGTFLGPKSVAANGAPVTLSPDGAHWANLTNSTVGASGPTQEVAMDPSITQGTRKRFTVLDWAGMDDLGWDLAGPGDANADRAVNFSDLVALAQNYGDASGVARWSQGDFTEDGNVNFADLVMLAQNYGTAAAEEVAAQYGPAFASDWAAAREVAANSVPEPGAGVLIVGVCAMLMRRRSGRGSSCGSGL
jgi:hypothetical protein